MDWSLLYSTINRRCQRISQRSFIEIFEAGRMERRNEPAIWCPLCQTSLAQADVEDSEEKHSFLNTVRFKAADTGDELLIATSRPELIPSCVGLIVSPDDDRYRNLVGRKGVTPLFNAEVPIFADRRVDPAFGTGIVMVCTFGDKTDIDWWRDYGLPLKISINPNGTMNANAGKYCGKTLSEARKEIIADLKEAGLLVEQQPITHVMNVHERCGTPVEYYVDLPVVHPHPGHQGRAARPGRKAPLVPGAHEDPLRQLGQRAQVGLVHLPAAVLRRAVPGLVLQ